MEEEYKLAKWLNDELSLDEIINLKNEKNFEILQKIKDHSITLKTIDFDQELMLKNIIASKKQEIKTISLSTWLYRIAAVVTIVFSILFLINQLNYEKLITSKNNLTFQLPDQSEVVLNTNSKIRYKKYNWNNNRILKLEGEAFFKVKKGQLFSVETNLGTVEVLGTQFNVKAINNKFEVRCFEGKVRVKKGKNSHILTQKMAISFNNKKTKTFSTNETSPNWNSNQLNLVYNSTTFEQIISDLESKYHVKIDIKNFKTNQLFNGTLPNNIDISIKIIASTYHLNIKKLNATTYVLIESE